MEWFTQSSVIEWADIQCLVRLERILRDRVYALNQQPEYGAVALVAKTHGLRDKDVQRGMALLVLIPNSLLK